MDGTLIMLSNTEMDVLQAWADGKIAPVIHAHWIPIESQLHIEKSGACSECGEAWIISDTEYFYYCPNCGAKMDEE